MAMKGDESSQKALCWRGPSRQSRARKRTRLDSSHTLKLGDSLYNMIVTIPADQPGLVGANQDETVVGVVSLATQVLANEVVPKKRIGVSAQRS